MLETLSEIQPSAEHTKDLTSSVDQLSIRTPSLFESYHQFWNAVNLSYYIPLSNLPYCRRPFFERSRWWDNKAVNVMSLRALRANEVIQTRCHSFKKKNMPGGDHRDVYIHLDDLHLAPTGRSMSNKKLINTYTISHNDVRDNHPCCWQPTVSVPNHFDSEYTDRLIVLGEWLSHHKSVCSRIRSAYLCQRRPSIAGEALTRYC